MTYYVYILASKPNGTLYTGMTNNLARRVYEHKHKIVPGFTEKYAVSMLVHFEETSDVNAAITREKQIKSWNRNRKITLIEANNRDWNDLAADWTNP